VDVIKARLVMASLATSLNLVIVWGVLGWRMGLDMTVRTRLVFLLSFLTYTTFPFLSFIRTPDFYTKHTHVSASASSLPLPQ
jgi:hypothetical protein